MERVDRSGTLKEISERSSGDSIVPFSTQLINPRLAECLDSASVRPKEELNWFATIVIMRWTRYFEYETGKTQTFCVGLAPVALMMNHW